MLQTPEQVRHLAINAANSIGLPVSLVLAIIEQESNFNTCAYNPEPLYRYFWDVRANKPFRKVTAEEIASERPPVDFPCLAGDRDQEWWAQQASWGCMQVMGAVAREHGVREPFLTALVDAELGITVGCKHLSQMVVRFGREDITPAIAAYNYGSPQHTPDGKKFMNQVYVDSVVAKMKKYA